MDRERLERLGLLIAATLFFLYLGFNTIMETRERAEILTADTTRLYRIAGSPATYTDETVNVSGRIQNAYTPSPGLPDTELREGNTTFPVTQCPNDAFVLEDDVLLTVRATNTTYNRTLSGEEVLERAETTNTTFGGTSSVTTWAHTTVLECERLHVRLSQAERED